MAPISISMPVPMLILLRKSHVSGSEVVRLYDAVNVNRAAEINYNEVRQLSPFVLTTPLLGMKDTLRRCKRDEMSYTTAL